MNDLTIPGIPQEYVALIVGIVTAIVIFIVGIIVAGWANALVRRALRSRKVDESLVGFLAALARWLVLAAAVIVALERVGLQTTSLVALLGSAGIAIGLALRGNLAHFASGVMILLFRPFSVGDYIETADKQGWVTNIGLFTTTLMTLDSETVLIPNGAVMVNDSASGKRRAHIAVGVAYGSKVSEVVTALTKAADRCETVMKDPAPVIAFVGRRQLAGFSDPPAL